MMDILSQMKEILNSGNGSISFVSNDGTVENNVFVTTNSFPLGDVVQSMSIIDKNIYCSKQLI